MLLLRVSCSLFSVWCVVIDGVCWSSYVCVRCCSFFDVVRSLLLCVIACLVFGVCYCVLIVDCCSLLLA